MKKAHAVIWSATAAKDLAGIIEYISSANPTIAYEKFLEIKKVPKAFMPFRTGGASCLNCRNRVSTNIANWSLPPGESFTGFPGITFMFCPFWIHGKMSKTSS